MGELRAHLFRFGSDVGERFSQVHAEGRISSKELNVQGCEVRGVSTEPGTFLHPHLFEALVSTPTADGRHLHEVVESDAHVASQRVLELERSLLELFRLLCTVRGLLLNGSLRAHPLCLLDLLCHELPSHLDSIVIDRFDIELVQRVIVLIDVLPSKFRPYRVGDPRIRVDGDRISSDSGNHADRVIVLIDDFFPFV